MTKQEFQRKHFGDFSKFMGSECGKDLIEYLRGQRPKLGWYKDGREQTEYMNTVAAGHEFCLLKMTDILTVDKLPEEIEADYNVREKVNPAKDAKAS